MNITKLIKSEVDSYLNGSIDLSEGVSFSMSNTIKKISQYQNKTYSTGRIDSQGRYKYFFDIITPRVNSEVKNIDFDTKDVTIYSNSNKDRLAVLLSNMYLRTWLKDNNKAEEINNAIDAFSAWGNVIWKKVENNYVMLDLKNVFLTNITAETLDDTDVIERHIVTQSDLRKNKDVWNNIEEVIENCWEKGFSATEKSSDIEATTKFYILYERNGEISEKDLYEAQGKAGGDEDKYVLAKIIVAGVNKSSNNNHYVLFAEEIKDKPYIEAHRGYYQGRWLRVGMYETLFDCQKRGNEIGNQISRGLEMASKQIYKTVDKLIVQNALTDLRNGDIIKTQDLQQIETRLQGFDQLIADWNRVIAHANELANSYEVVTGESMPSGTPFRLGNMQNQNANKLFDRLREKLAISLEKVFTEWIIPVMMKELKTKKILEITGSSDYLDEYYKLLVDAWYINNLLVFPPHSSEEAQTWKELKLEEIKKKGKQMLKVVDDFWQGFKPRANVDIAGESINLPSELESIATFIGLETDPVRRSALIEMAMTKKGIDISSLPKTPPVKPQPVVQQPTNINQQQPVTA